MAQLKPNNEVKPTAHSLRSPSSLHLRLLLRRRGLLRLKGGIATVVLS